MNGLLLAGLAVAAAAVIDDAIVDFDNARTGLRSARRAVTGRPPWCSRSRRCGGPWCSRRSWRSQRPCLCSGWDSATVSTPTSSGRRSSPAPWLCSPRWWSCSRSRLCSPFLLRGRPVGRGASPVAGRLEKTYGNVLVRGVARPAVAVTAFGVIAVAGIAVAPILERDMRPHLQERTLLVHWEAAPGTSYTEMSRITRASPTSSGPSPASRTSEPTWRALTSDEISSVNSGEPGSPSRPGSTTTRRSPRSRR